ncbi:type II toxin-antitoxin system RelB/DinJ family antitoxin [Candidatus Peregrinibacteria bacterium]|nr:type II toxin-antitoxin system RelB/DinJ family antitoxin [Candidatus Peregrinibacteria bacterium]
MCRRSSSTQNEICKKSICHIETNGVQLEYIAFDIVLMGTGRLQHRIDPVLQQRAEEILLEQGIKPSQAITIFYTEVTRKRGFPFLPSEVPNDELKKDLREARKGKGIKKFKNKKVFFDALKKL